MRLQGISFSLSLARREKLLLFRSGEKDTARPRGCVIDASIAPGQSGKGMGDADKGVAYLRGEAEGIELTKGGER